jgi:signal peptidase I
MKKKVIIIVFVLGVVQLVLWSFDLLRFYNYPTVANEPNLKLNSKFVWSSIAKPERLDFICFKAHNEEFGKYEAAMRLVGLPKDIIEIKSGDLFVNGQFIDNQIDLRRLYVCDKNSFLKNIQPKAQEMGFEYYYITVDSFQIFMDDSFVKKENLKVERKVKLKDESESSIKLRYNEDWNADNFGPLKLPENMYFVMGDNRENSYDSRYLGLVSKEDILGTVIYIY